MKKLDFNIMNNTPRFYNNVGLGDIKPINKSFEYDIWINLFQLRNIAHVIQIKVRVEL